MLRRKARERREYLYRKSVEDQHRKIQDKKDRVRRAVEDHSLIDTDLKRDALELQVRQNLDRGFMSGMALDQMKKNESEFQSCPSPLPHDLSQTKFQN